MKFRLEINRHESFWRASILIIDLHLNRTGREDYVSPEPHVLRSSSKVVPLFPILTSLWLLRPNSTDLLSTISMILTLISILKSYFHRALPRLDTF